MAILISFENSRRYFPIYFTSFDNIQHDQQSSEFALWVRQFTQRGEPPQRNCLRIRNSELGYKHGGGETPSPLSLQGEKSLGEVQASFQALSTPNYELKTPN